MRIFALETNLEKAARQFLQAGEQELMIVRYHPMLFFIRTLRQVLFTLVLTAAGVAAIALQAPVSWVLIGCVVLWLFIIFPGVVRAYIDWRFDAIIVTTDNVIILDQTSLFHSESRQMHLENFASINASTQFWNLFPFGKLTFDLKEGIGERLTLRYIPRAAQVAVQIGSCVRTYQRRGRGPFVPPVTVSE